MKMKPEIKASWVAALRSGEYRQGKGRLRSKNNRFCCLGVLCNLHAQGHPRIAKAQSSQEFYMGRQYMPPRAVYRWAGLNGNVVLQLPGRYKDSLTRLNDSGHSFEQIADLIEEQL